MADPVRLRRGSIGLATALLLIAGLGACSSGSGEEPSPSATATETGSPTAPTRVARIGVIASQTGPLAPVGKGVRDAVELAVREANTTQEVPGWSFDLVPANDTSTQSGGQQAASGLAADERMIGVVGTTRSTIDEGVQPILNAAGVAMVSPGGTAATLTHRRDDDEMVRPFPTYFRLAPTDADQGRAAARWVDDDLRVRRVAVISDGSGYGRLVSGTFRAEAIRLGLKRPIIRTLAIPSALSEPTAQARRARLAEDIKAARVGAVFFGGSGQQAAAFADVLRAEGVKAPLVGGDALLDGRYVRDLDTPTATATATARGGAATRTGAAAGTAAASPSASATATIGPGEGDAAVFPGAAAEDLDTAQGFLRRYRAQGFGADPGPYGASAYDAARAIILAFAAGIDEATEIDDDVRASVVTELDRLRFEGATGPVGFDRWGDAEERPLAVYVLTGSRWTFDAVVRVR